MPVQHGVGDFVRFSVTAQGDSGKHCRADYAGAGLTYLVVEPRAATPGQLMGQLERFSGLAQPGLLRRPAAVDYQFAAGDEG